MGRPKTRRNMGGAKAHPDTEDRYEDAVDREDEDATVDTADEENCQVDDDQSQESQSVDGSVVKEKPFQFKRGVQPSKRRVAQQEANAFCIQMSVTSEEKGEAGAPPPRYAWTAVLIKDIVQSWLQVEIHEVLITVPGEAILFFRKRSEKQGLTREQAQDLATYFPAQRDWVGKKVAMTARVINLFTARGYCHMAKEYRKAKKTANAKSTTGRSTKTTTKPSRTAPRISTSARNINANAARSSSSASDRTTSWVQEQNERNRRHDQRPARRHQDGQKRRHRRADPPGGGGGGDDPGWSDWSDSQDDHNDNQEDARSYSTYSDTTRRGSA